MSFRAWLYAVAVVTAPFLALATGEPSPVLVAVPLAVFLVVGTYMSPRLRPVVGLEMEAERTRVGERVELSLMVEGDGTLAHVELGLPPGFEIEAVDGGRRVHQDRLEIGLHGGRGAAQLTVTPRRWGTYPIGPARVAVAGPFRMALSRAESAWFRHLVVLPGFEESRRLVEPLRTNMHSGDVSSTQRGPGIDVAELRRWAPGDSVRMVNWRATARSDDVWVSERHADRNGDLILVVDAIAPPGSAVAESVRSVVELAGSLVGVYGVARHRLGLISLTGSVAWFGLASGMVHVDRLLAALMETVASRPPVWMAVDRILDRAVRPPSMAVFVTPLLDDSVTGRIHRLSRSGIDVVVIAVDAAGWMPAPGDRVQSLARRIWQMERERTVDAIRSTGTAVAEWAPGRPLEEMLEEVGRWRRHLRRARV